MIVTMFTSLPALTTKSEMVLTGDVLKFLSFIPPPRRE